MINKIPSLQIKEIKQEIYNITDRLTRSVANQARKDLTQVIFSAINDFYKQRIPEYYVRTYNLYNMVMSRPLEKCKGGYRAVVSAQSLTMFDNYTVSPNVVFNLMWVQGHRGTPTQNLLPKWYPTATTLTGYELRSNSPHNIASQFVRSWGAREGRRAIDRASKRL